MWITRWEYARAKAAAKKAVQTWKATKNKDGSYTINTWSKAGTTIWWSWGWSSSGWAYRWAGGSGLTNTDYATKYANNSAYNKLVSQYWANNVHDALDYMSTWWWSKSQLSYLLTWWKSTSTTPNIGWVSSGNKSNDDLNSYTEASISNYNNALKHLKSQGMSDEDAKSTAAWLLEKTSYNTKSEQQKADEMSPLGFDDDTNDTNIDIEDIYNQYYDPNEDVLWDYSDEINNIKDTVNDFIDSYDKQETTKENKAEVSHDPIFDYNTYFQNNIVWDTAKVWETWQQAEQPKPSNDLTDITSDIEWVTQSLQNLGFLEPNGEASASMPDTQEQADIKTYENPESIVDDFNQTIEWLSEWWTGLSPQAWLEAYKDFRNRLQKFRDENNLTEEQYNEFLKQLQGNEGLRTALINRKR